MTPEGQRILDAIRAERRSLPMHEILAEQRLHGLHAFVFQPRVERFDEPFADEFGSQYSAVEQNVRGARQTAAASAHAAVFGCRGLLAQETREVFRHRGIGGRPVQILQIDERRILTVIPQDAP